MGKFAWGIPDRAMKHRIRLGAAVLASLTMLIAVGGCGDDAEPTALPSIPGTSPTASVSLEPVCFATEAYALEYIVAVVGRDKAPTAFDAVNQGGCEFQFPVDRITIELLGTEATQTAVVALSAPTTEVRFPLAADTDGPLVDAGLPEGLYERTVTASDAQSGRGGLIPGFEPVILVRDPDSVTARLLRARSRWDRSRITSYTYSAKWQCFCIQEYVADVEIRVVNGQVTGTTFVDSSVGGDVPDPERFGTVENLFSYIAGAVAGEAARIEVEYHPETGYPAEVFIDRDERLADEEMGFTVSSLTVTN